MPARLDGALDHAQTDDRQRTGRAGDNDVVGGQMLTQLVEANGLAAVLFGQRPAAFQRAVGDGDLLRLAGAEVRGAQFDHFACADEQDALTSDRLENAFGQMDAGSGHRDDVGANGRRRAHFLGDRK